MIPQVGRVSLPISHEWERHREKEREKKNTPEEREDWPDLIEVGDLLQR